MIKNVNSKPKTNSHQVVMVTLGHNMEKDNNQSNKQHSKKYEKNLGKNDSEMK